MNLIIGVLIFCLPLFIIPYSIRIIKPTHRGVVERFGKYLRILQPGLNFVIPIIDVVRYRNITERLADVQPQDIITKDN